METLSLQNSSSVFNHSANSLFSELSMSQHMSQSTDSVDMAGISHNSSIHQPVSTSFYFFFSKINRPPKQSRLAVSKSPSKDRKGKKVEQRSKIGPGDLSLPSRKDEEGKKIKCCDFEKNGERSF